MASTPDLSEFVALSNSKKRRRCGVAVIADELSPEDAEKLFAACAAADGSSITVSAVIEWCKQHGHDISQNTIVYHRRGRCSCHAGS